MLSFPILKSKPYSAITVQITRLTSGQHEADDMSGIPDLIEVIGIQAGGPTEAARAIRKKLKYGSVDTQLRALTVLDGLIENAGPRFQRAFADEPLLERLRVCSTDSLSDPEVKKKCQILFRQWAASYKSTPGMDRVVALEKQLPKYKQPVTQAQSRVLRESEPNPNEDPFSNDEDDEDNPRPSLGSPAQSSSASTSYHTVSRPSLNTQWSQTKKKETGKHRKKEKSKAFNLEKEKPQILQNIASSSIASTNLMNALKLIDRDSKRCSEDPETVKRFEACKALRRQILRYIQYIESEQWLGSLINANDNLIEALMAYEVLDKSVEDDSDSDDEGYGNIAKSSRTSKPEPSRQGIPEDFSALAINEKAKQQHPTMLQDSERGVRNDEDSDSESGREEDDPFADRNAVHTPKSERPGMTWREV